MFNSVQQTANLCIWISDDTLLSTAKTNYLSPLGLKPRSMRFPLLGKYMVIWLINLPLVENKLKIKHLDFSLLQNFRFTDLPSHPLQFFILTAQRRSVGRRKSAAYDDSHPYWPCTTNCRPVHDRCRQQCGAWCVYRAGTTVCRWRTRWSVWSERAKTRRLCQTCRTMRWRWRPSERRSALRQVSAWPPGPYGFPYDSFWAW